MKIEWYLRRLKKMTFREIIKRLSESLLVFRSRIAFARNRKRPYAHFAPKGGTILLRDLPGTTLPVQWDNYRLFERSVDLTKQVDWYFSEKGAPWPQDHWATIDYRPGNPHGDIRINWELNRLQFLPAMALSDEGLAASIIDDWLRRNPYLQGPSYCSAMEVALRWISVFWAVCLFRRPVDDNLIRDIGGLAFTSGHFIESRLSTYSSAGNHLIVEAVGLFWIGKALEETDQGRLWLDRARRILWEQIPRQIHPDGVGREQSFWYLGFVLDAVLHYFLLEERSLIPEEVASRVEGAAEFLHETAPDGDAYFDYGDRDDGFVFRDGTDYQESPFPAILNVASSVFGRLDWQSSLPWAVGRHRFWTGIDCQGKVGTRAMPADDAPHSGAAPSKRGIRTFPHGGITVMKWGKGSLLFRHAPLGLEPTYAHGHADALAVLFFWGAASVLIDPGTGQYNGRQAIRNYFRSTLAHNTVQVEGRDQAEMLGPFMWRDSYAAELTLAEEGRSLVAEAAHRAYEGRFKVVHRRRVEWEGAKRVTIRDRFSCPSEAIRYTGALHLGDCKGVTREAGSVSADFEGFTLSLLFSPSVTVAVHHGSENPLVGWRSRRYGSIEPAFAITFSSTIGACPDPEVVLEINET